ncbi:MAG TPA: copper chaperone PCu(A)C, partial [Acetobacteraceae bacterium]|nr:copper chaperone PCu(A)C [Acetobacteraceae bacterium]
VLTRRSMQVKLRWVLHCLVVLPAVVLAQAPGVHVESAWSRPAIQGGTGVVYLTITDSGTPDRLVSISSPVANKAELHESFTDQGIARMREVATLAVAPGSTVTLAPGGYHIMLMGLKQPLKEGDSFPVTLGFQGSGQVTSTVTVRRTAPPRAATGSQ